MNQNTVELANLRVQLDLLKASYRANYELLKGEEMRFKLGESSLFLVNSRESKLIEVNEKLLQVEAKIRKAQLKSLWLNGSIFEDLN